MEFFKIRKDIPFMRNALIFNAISFITFALAVFFLFSRGLHLSVEFTGGTVMEVSYSKPAEVEKFVQRFLLWVSRTCRFKTLVRPET